MKAYLDLLNHVMTAGNDRSDRTGVGTRAVFGYQLRHNLAAGFPLLTTKKVFFRGVVAELLWFLAGDTNVRTLREQGVHIWDAWADEQGNLGPVYGHQWRKFGATGLDQGRGWVGGCDQIKELVDGLRRNPNSRRHIVTAWNPMEVPAMKLPPCHPFWQCQVDGDRLHLSLYMRSCDAFLGLPFNLASYALLLSMLAQVTGLVPGEVIISFGDLHIYSNHFEQVKEQMSRVPKELPKLVIHCRGQDIFHFSPIDFCMEGYDPHPAIKAPIAV